MKKRLYTFFESIGLDENLSNQIIDNISGELIEEEFLVKNAIDLILKDNESTNDEVEKKVLDIDLGILIDKLKKIGAVETFNGKIEDNRYDFESHLLKNEGILLRLRETSKGSFITLKKQLDSSLENEKSCSIDNEFELEVKDIKKVVKSILDLGLDEIKGKKYTKHRISYKLNGVHFDFDKYDNIPWILEIESSNSDKIDEWINELGLNSYTTVKYGYRKLKELYGLS